MNKIIKDKKLDDRKKQKLQDYLLDFQSIKKLTGNKFILEESFLRTKIELLNLHIDG